MIDAEGTMSAIDTILRILELEPEGQDCFRGLVPQVGWQRVFGGLVIAQSLAAAHRTVEGRHPHSLHAYFLLAGDPSLPISYAVDRIRDGRSFATRRVVASQQGRAIFALSCSFQEDEPDGFVHQQPMPDVPMPEDVPTYWDIKRDHGDRIPHPVRAYFERDRPIEIRPVDFARYTGGKSAQLGARIWIKATATMPDRRDLHECLLAYASDLTLLDAALVPHETSVFDPGVLPASLDHAMWFHRPFRADEWMLYAQDSPNAGAGRGFARGLIYTRDGRLIASVAQEGIIRQKRS